MEPECVEKKSASALGQSEEYAEQGQIPKKSLSAENGRSLF